MLLLPSPITNTSCISFTASDVVLIHLGIPARFIWFDTSSAWIRATQLLSGLFSKCLCTDIPPTLCLTVTVESPSDHVTIPSCDAVALAAATGLTLFWYTRVCTYCNKVNHGHEKSILQCSLLSYPCGYSFSLSTTWASIGRSHLYTDDEFSRRP